jgi:hypothetical protein
MQASDMIALLGQRFCPIKSASDHDLDLVSITYKTVLYPR